MREDTEKTVARNCNKVGLLGLLVTLGIVFGDIGTSPLYVMKAILHTGETINESTILGALSCIIWTLTLQTTIKYVCVALRADNNGEGGILALYALLRRLKSKWIYILAIIGASTLLADGIITPAITVTTAIEGLESISPDLPVIPITLAIITMSLSEVLRNARTPAGDTRMIDPSLTAVFSPSTSYSPLPEMIT